MMRKSFRLATFDVTNTLLKFRTSVGYQYAKVGRLYGVETDINKINASFKHHWKFMRKVHPNFGRATGLTSQLWWKEIVSRCFHDGNSAMSNSQLQVISDHLFRLYATDECWEIYPGTVEQLKAMRDSNIILGVISNFDERLDSVLSSTGLKSFFHFILASYVVKNEKPDKVIFDMALKEAHSYGIMDPSVAVHVGDNINLDYLAAKNAGWSALLLKDSKQVDDIEYASVNEDEVVHDIRELSKYILH